MHIIIIPDKLIYYILINDNQIFVESLRDLNLLCGYSLCQLIYDKQYYQFYARLHPVCHVGIPCQCERLDQCLVSLDDDVCRLCTGL